MKNGPSGSDLPLVLSASVHIKEARNICGRHTGPGANMVLQEALFFLFFF